MEMFDAEVINIEELRAKSKELNLTIEKLNEEIKMVELNISKCDLLDNILNETFKDIQSVLSTEHMTNGILSRIIEKIIVDENGKVDIYLKILYEIGLDENVHVQYNRSYGCNLIERFIIEVA